MAMVDLGSDSPSSDIELAGSGQRSLSSKKRATDMHPDATTVLDLKAFYS